MGYFVIYIYCIMFNSVYLGYESSQIIIITLCVLLLSIIPHRKPKTIQNDSSTKVILGESMSLLEMLSGHGQLKGSQVTEKGHFSPHDDSYKLE